MGLKKTFSKSKDVCKVTFNLPANDAKEACVVGDFNGWDTSSHPMKKSKNSFSATVELKPGQDYQFRYFVDGNRWENDGEADGVVPGPYHDCQNCVVSTRQ